MPVRHALASLAAGALTLVLAPSAQAANVDIGVSIGISQPGVYGRIDIGRFPPPQVVYSQPIVVMPPPMVIGRPVQPVYMWVPPGHRKDWRRHCGSYRACGVPVVFVRDDWYEAHVHPRGKGKGKGRGKGRDYDD